MQTPASTTRATWPLVVLIVGASYAAVAALPFFSESWTHRHVATGMAAWWDAFDLARTPLRPFQHLLFWAITRGEGASPAVARLPAFLLHAGSCLMLAELARRLGASRRGVWLAALLFALAPNVKNLVWVAGIGQPGRVFFTLTGLVLLADRRRAASLSRAAGVFLCFVAAAGFHQSAMVFPALGLLMVWTGAAAGGSAEGTDAPRARGLRAVLGDRALLLTCAAGALFVLYVGWLREERYHGVRDLNSIAVHAVKATFWYLPEDLRIFATDGFRGVWGLVGKLAGGTVLLVLGLGWLRAVILGTALGRFVALGVALDMALPVLSSGFHQRYAYLGTALLACGIGCWAGKDDDGGRRVSRMPAVLFALLLAFLWGRDQFVDTVEYRRAGAVVDTILVQVGEERARVGEGTSVTLVDLPDQWGREEDLPVFNWGFRFAAEEAGHAGPWVQVRTRPFITTTDFVQVGEEELRRRMAGEAGPVLLFDAELGELVRPKALGGGPPR
jgi:hypothetical protein